jgi:hypothetical protein
VSEIVKVKVKDLIFLINSLNLTPRKPSYLYTHLEAAVVKGRFLIFGVLVTDKIETTPWSFQLASQVIRCRVSRRSQSDSQRECAEESGDLAGYSVKSAQTGKELEGRPEIEAAQSRLG